MTSCNPSCNVNRGGRHTCHDPARRLRIGACHRPHCMCRRGRQHDRHYARLQRLRLWRVNWRVCIANELVSECASPNERSCGSLAPAGSFRLPAGPVLNVEGCHRLQIPTWLRGRLLYAMGRGIRRRWRQRHGRARHRARLICGGLRQTAVQHGQRRIAGGRCGRCGRCSGRHCDMWCSGDVASRLVTVFGCCLAS